MSVKQKILRSSALGQRPAAGTRQPGELYINFADKQLGVIDVAQDPQDLLAVRYFSTDAAYLVGDVVLYAVDGQMYQAITPNGPGPFVPTDWITAIDSFVRRLKGYETDGTHEEYIGDLNAILDNSKYFITDGTVTNAPSDFGSGGGWITTDLATDNTTAIQIIWGGGDSGNERRVWQRQRIVSVWQPWVLIARPALSQIGEMVELPGLISVPAGRGLVEANGQLLLRSSYPEFWNFVTTSTPFITDAAWVSDSNGGARGVGYYSDGDGSTTFRVPDFRGEFRRGMNYAASGGSAARDPNRSDNSLDWQLDELRSHRHPFTAQQNIGGFTDDGGAPDQRSVADSRNTSFVGGSETRGRNIPVLVCIRAEDIL